MKLTKNASSALALSAASLLVLTGCASGDSASSGMIQELGDSESAVTILAWPGYVEDGSNDPATDWTSSFEEATGCEVTVKTYGTSDEAVNLMKTGEYDVVAASGDATQRLIAGGDVMPINTELVPSYAGVFEFLKNQSHNTVDGVNYGVPHGYGANLLLYNKDT
jgi:putative spermidine/putrescine transport system substrate-binding protein